jgi:predicted unusual protein kinase regulating ubiquinone biosynthesis (AarF/ABC1/UbiB family)
LARENKPLDRVVSTSRFGRSFKLGQMAARIGGDLLRAGGKAAFRRLDAATGFSDLAHLQTAEILLSTLGEMKGAALKLGQMLSYIDPDLPAPYRLLLERLQADAPAMDFETVCEVVQEELGAPPDCIFSHFEATPMAAASIGQVHRARLKNGREAAVKVQFPGIADAMAADVKNGRLMLLFGAMLYRENRSQDLQAELLEVLLDECDYRKEARNQSDFGNLWHDEDGIYIPEVYLDHCSERVFTSEYVEGANFRHFVTNASQTEKNHAGYLLLKFSIRSAWRHGMFNADPHPGNYIFMPDGRVAFIDFGCTKRWDDTFVQDLNDHFRAVYHRDREAFLDVSVRMGFIKPRLRDEIDVPAFRAIFEYDYRPFLHDGVFTFTPEYVKEIWQLVKNPTVRRLTMPRHLLFANRWIWGLNAVLAGMRASNNFHPIIQDLL